MNTHEENTQWFVKSMPWLMGWLANIKPCEFDPKEQVFSRSRIIPYESPVKFDFPTAKRQALVSLNDEFIPMVLFTLVFGVSTQIQGKSFHATIDGFFAKMGRLPNFDDKVSIHASEFTPIAEPRERDDAEGLTLVHYWIIRELEIL